MIRNASRLAATSVALFMLASPVFAQAQPSASHIDPSWLGESHTTGRSAAGTGPGPR